VELFLNIAWVMFSTSLALLWIKRSHNVSDGSRQQDWKVQLLALAMLILILLPVISMTDDMQAISATEIEHVMRRADLLPSTDQPADPVVPLSAKLLPGKHPCNLQAFAYVELYIPNVRPQCGSIRQMANRPPPLSV